MVMLLCVYIIIEALIITGTTYGRRTILFSLPHSSSAKASSAAQGTPVVSKNSARGNHSVTDIHTMQRAMQSKSMAVLPAMNKRHIQQHGGVPFPSRRSGHFPAIHWCKPLGFRAAIPQRDSVVALASFPGSGNTWLRYLLQQATGIITGSIYKDHALLRNGFPGIRH